MTPFKNFYKTLNVSSESSTDAIKSAYRELAKKYHPDINPKIRSHDHFLLIKEAYEILIDPQERRKYDEVYEQHLQQTDRPSEHSKQTKSRGKNLLYHINISLKEALLGCKKSIQFVHLKKGARTTTGIEISIPAGIRDQQKLRVRGAGESIAPEQTPGDLLVVVHVIQSEQFKLLGDDLHLKVFVHPIDLLLGTTFILDLPQLAQTPLRVPSNHKELTAGLSLSGSGFQKSSSQYGNLFIHFVIDVPTKLNENQRTTLEKIRAELPAINCKI